MEETWDPEFEETLRAFLPDMNPEDVLSPDTDLVLAGLNSIGTVELLLALENRYEVAVPDEFLESSMFGTPASLWKVFSGLRSSD
ncbi:phosphopantetheine-binding protein [Streptomyces silvensis]|uniref:Carrier domain-containing protein n=1 Tax=Streptomyces silvensis TaxID=1765722 RepID=A0A0W7X6V2_9ACTN|nr:phosphopantetheine-binding protein [Streptomyces silvensis]KUF18670.1 hypothetical protein AT728_06290 [Streptomyces silvensis]